MSPESSECYCRESPLLILTGLTSLWFRSLALLFVFNRWLRRRREYLYPRKRLEAGQESASTAIAAFRPLMAITLPPGCVQAPQR